jgi:hypothetical protein
MHIYSITTFMVVNAFLKNYFTLFSAKKKPRIAAGLFY